jgi:glucose/mannose transport system substrate-binding protein
VKNAIYDVITAPLQRRAADGAAAAAALAEAVAAAQ